MKRRTILQAALVGATGLIGKADAALKKMKVTRVRFWEKPAAGPLFNQSAHIVTIETDSGLMGIGDGGHPDAFKQCAGLLIGQDPTRIEHLWQLMYRGFFYPAGREKLHALGALDVALWDLKGKALGVPLYDLLGGLSRDHVPCYSTGFRPPGSPARPERPPAVAGTAPPEPPKAAPPPRPAGSVEQSARACIAAGFRAFRTAAVGPSDNWTTYDSRRSVPATVEHCKQIRAGVGKDGDWCIDYHTRLDFADAVRLSQLLEPLDPMFCEDLVRSENPEVYRTLRPLVKVPIAVGEQFGDRWDLNMLVEQHLIDWSRVTIPNCGGITEFMKIAAMCETHYVALAPHFTGPVAVAALGHVLASFSGTAVMEIGGVGSQPPAYLPKSFDLKNGRLMPNDRPGVGVEVDFNQLKLTAEVTTHPNNYHIYRRPDGSITNW